MLGGGCGVQRRAPPSLEAMSACSKGHRIGSNRTHTTYATPVRGLQVRERELYNAVAGEGVTGIGRGEGGKRMRYVLLVLLHGGHVLLLLSRVSCDSPGDTRIRAVALASPVIHLAITAVA